MTLEILAAEPVVIRLEGLQPCQIKCAEDGTLVAYLSSADVEAVQEEVERLRDDKIPYYWADPTDHTRIIRSLAGRETRGVFLDGRFLTED